MPTYFTDLHGIQRQQSADTPYSMGSSKLQYDLDLPLMQSTLCSAYHPNVVNIHVHLIFLQSFPRLPSYKCRHVVQHRILIESYDLDPEPRSLYHIDILCTLSKCEHNEKIPLLDDEIQNNWTPICDRDEQTGSLCKQNQSPPLWGGGGPNYGEWGGGGVDIIKQVNNPLDHSTQVSRKSLSE